MVRRLLRTGTCSTIRVCDELGRYRKGEIRRAPWGGLVRIVGVKRYRKAEDIPTWGMLDKGMKISARMGGRYGGSRWDYVVFRSEGVPR